MAVIEIFDLDEEQAAQAANTPEATPKKKRTPRKKAAETSPTANAASTDSAPKVAESAERSEKSSETPAPKRRGRKPKASSTDAASGADAPADTATTPKKSRSRKSKDKEKSAPEAVADKTVDTTGAKRSKSTAPRAHAEASDPAAPKPARRGRKPKAAPVAPPAEIAADAQTAPAPQISVEQPAIEPLSAPVASVSTPVIEPAPTTAESNGVTEMSRPLVQFEPVSSALALAFTTLPALTGQEGAEGSLGGSDSGSAEGDAPRSSKSRSRSARRRKAAARRRAEAAAGTAEAAEAADIDSRADDADDLADDLEAAYMNGVDISVLESARSEMRKEREARNTDVRESAAVTDFDDSVDEHFSDADDNAPEIFESSESSELSESADASEASETPQKKRRSRSRGRRKNRDRAVQTVDAAEIEEAFDAEYDDDDDADTQPAPRVSHVDRKMLVSVLPGELTEVVLMEAGKVQEYYVEMEHQAKIRGNIYKGIVSNIDVNLQAAFVNYGNVKNGFLQIDEVHPEYWLTHHEPVKGHKYPPIQKVMKPGQEVLVQVVKEPNGAKGAFLTTWVSLAGRFLVLTPGQEQIGISRKVEDGEERNRLRELIKGLNPGEGLGAIVRTVSAGTSKTTLQKDLSFLKRVWKDIRKRAGIEKAPSLIYKEPGLASRSVRDYLSDDVSEIWVDDAETTDAIRDMTSLLFPRKGDLVHVYQNNGKTLWEQFKVRKYLDQIHAREVVLPSGGRLVFDQTEALMAIDINSGKTGGKTNFESMALRTNVEAAEMIAHQLRLRDVGGQVVIDFIEMRDQSHVREVEKTLRNAMKCDRARYDIGKMSSFGLLQIVRQRIGSSAISISQEPCPHCSGTGLRRNMEWQSLQTLRDLQVQLRAASISGQCEFILALEPELALYMLNHKRERLTSLEKEYSIRLEIKTGV